MNTTLIEISNIFNLMVQADSRLKFYHFGWRSDINKNIDNNFDEGTKTGRLFPALHFDVPDFFQPSEELNYLGFKEDIQVNLYFDDLQNYDNSGEQKTDNLIEQWANLKQLADDFISNLSEVLQYYKAGFIRSVPRFEPKSNLFNDRLITFEVSFTIAHFSECTEEVNKIDLFSLPSVSLFPASDLENYLILISSSCKSLDFDGVNEKINCTNDVIFNIERTDGFTISSWFYADLLGVGQFNALMIKYDNSLERGYLLGFKDGKLKFSLQHNGGANGIMVNAVNSINSGQWYNVTATYSGTSSASGLAVYLNGISQDVNIAFDNLTATVTNTIPLTISGSDVFFF